MTTVSEDIGELRNTMTGRVLQPGDSGYEEARRIQNGLIDKRPAVIARCLGARDVVEAVNYAREHGLEVSVRGGGHNVAGRAVTDGGLMIDLGEMRGVVVDPSRRIAIAQGGATWGDLYRETELHGLSTNGGVVSTTGVAGLTLGGGIGWLMGRCGLSVDNLRRVELVTASGEVVTASEEASPDLLWALRGGGGNFGVATSLEFALHEVGPTVIGGLLVHPFEHAREMLRFYRDFTSAGIPDDLTVFAGLLHAPDGSGAKVAAMVCCHAGSPEQAQQDLQALRAFGSPILDTVGPTPFSAFNTILDEAMPKGALNYWKSNFVRELSDDAIETLVTQFGEALPPMNAALFEHLHGAATRVAPDATAFPHRQEGYNLGIFGVWTDPDETESNIAWVRRAFEAMSPHFRDGRYVNYLGADEGEEAAHEAYGAVYARLRKTKQAIDPDNFFHLNQNIAP